MAQTMTATFVRDVSADYQGNVGLYRVDPPAEFDDGGQTTDYVVVSAVDVPYSGPETYIFPADADGEVVNWGELDGSYRGGLDHEEALRNAGYTITDGETE